MKVCEVWRICDSPEHPISTDRKGIGCTPLDLDSVCVCVCTCVCVRVYVYVGRIRGLF